jgi:hypothetical protein
MGTRARFGLAGLVLGVLIAALGPGGSARAAEIGTDPPEKCNPTGRTICLTVRTYENITASDPSRPDGKRFTWVEWTYHNGGGTTLTNPAVTVSFADLCGAGLSACSGASTAQFELPASPNICSVQGGNLVCTYPNLAAGAFAATTRVYFKTADNTATRDVRASRINVTATAKERANDGNPCDAGDPNCDTFTSSIVNSYEPDLDAAFTFGLNGKRFNLPTNDGLASFTFTSASSSVFLATFKKLTQTESADFCFSTVKCFDRTLFVNTQSAPGFGAANPVVFHSLLFDSPVSENNLNAIHFYDAVPLTLLAGNRLTPGSTPGFARMDGLRLAAPALGLAAGKYFVVNYQASNNSFQLSLAKGGAPLALTPTPSPAGNPIRIVGDDSDERSTEICSTDIPSPIPTLPRVCVNKVGPKTLDAFLWDTGNGWANW